MNIFGYGDVYHITAAGRVLSTIIAFLGIGMVAIPTGIITAGFTKIINKEKEDKQDKKRILPLLRHKIDE